MNASKKEFYLNVVKVFLSNLVLIISGIITGFLVPKLLGVTDYGYYKIFNLYTTYVVFLDFGLANGVFLVFGGYTKETLPKEKLRLYFKVLFCLQCLFFILITAFAIITLKGEYVFIFMMLAIYLVANNVTNYYEKVSVAIGEFNALSKRNILKSVLSVEIVFLLWIGMKLNIPVAYYRIYTTLFVIMYEILAVQYVHIFKDISFGKTASFNEEVDSLKEIIKSGFVLLLADTVASLILTLDRQFVSLLFDVDTYAVYSFAYSMLKIIVLAVSAISSILYPALKRMTPDEMRGSYVYTLSIISLIAFLCQLAYYPLCLIVELFLPNYIDSLPIFRILFPGITLNILISMIMINHYKALKKQQIYFVISVVVLALSAALNVLAYLISKTSIGFSIASVVTIVIWYLISGYFIEKEYGCKTIKQMLYISVNSAIYYAVSAFVKNYYLGFAINLLLFVAISLMIYNNELKKTVKSLRS